jgi:hypothetical protein
MHTSAGAAGGRDDDGGGAPGDDSKPSFGEFELKQANRLRQSKRGAKKQIRQPRFSNACKDWLSQAAPLLSLGTW